MPPARLEPVVYLYARLSVPYPGLLEIQSTEHRFSSRGNQNFVRTEHALVGGGDDLTIDLLDTLYPGAVVDLDALLREDTFEEISGLLVSSRDQMRIHVSEDHVGAQTAEGLRHLGAYGPSADDHETLGNLLLLEDVHVGELSHRIESGNGRHHRFGSGCYKDLLATVGLLAHSYRVRIDETRIPLVQQQVYLVEGLHRLRSVDVLHLPADHREGILYSGLFCRVDAVVLEVVDDLAHLPRLQQRLARNTAVVQALSADLVLLYAQHGQPHLYRHCRDRHSRRAHSDHYDVVHAVHSFFSFGLQKILRSIYNNNCYISQIVQRNFTICCSLSQYSTQQPQRRPTKFAMTR